MHEYVYTYVLKFIQSYDIQTSRWDGDWLILTEPVDLDAGADRQRIYHGTCLSQACDIFQKGYTVGPGIHGGYKGFWGLWIEQEQFAEYARGHAMERVKLERGFLEVPPGPGGQERWICGWTAPVVISGAFRKESLQLSCCSEVRVGQPPCRLAVLPGAQDSVKWIVCGSYAMEIHIHKPTYKRYLRLQSQFPLLQAPSHHRSATHVACQTKLGSPQTLLQGFFNLSCGRVVAISEARRLGWRLTGSCVWVCPQCDGAHRCCVPYCCYPSQTAD